MEQFELGDRIINRFCLTLDGLVENGHADMWTVEAQTGLGPYRGFIDFGGGQIRTRWYSTAMAALDDLAIVAVDAAAQRMTEH